MKVKIIDTSFAGDKFQLELDISNFIRDKRVIDIKYQDSYDDGESHKSVLIMYEDIPEAEENDCYD